MRFVRLYAHQQKYCLAAIKCDLQEMHVTLKKTAQKNVRDSSPCPNEYRTKNECMKTNDTITTQAPGIKTATFQNRYKSQIAEHEYSGRNNRLEEEKLYRSKTKIIVFINILLENKILRLQSSAYTIAHLSRAQV